MSIPPAPLSGKMGDAGSTADAASGSKPAPPWDGPAAAKLAVIGAGYAGMAAAVELAAAGRQVEVFEASRVLGGRARATQIAGFSVDNGQHILVGAYSETLRLMRLVGAASASSRTSRSRRGSTATKRRPASADSCGSRCA